MTAESPVPEPAAITEMQRLEADLARYGRAQWVGSPALHKRYRLQRECAWKFGEALNAKVKTLDTRDGFIIFGLFRINLSRLENQEITP